MDQSGAEYLPQQAQGTVVYLFFAKMMTVFLFFFFCLCFVSTVDHNPLQITGQPSVLYYADTIFTDVGLSSAASVLTAAFKLVATLVTVFTVDKHGRWT